MQARSDPDRVRRSDVNGERERQDNDKERQGDDNKRNGTIKPDPAGPVMVKDVTDKKARDGSPHSDDDSEDSEGLCYIQPGEYLRDHRYKVLGVAGQGTFGTVLDCLDTKYDERVALKIVRSVKRYLEAAYVEVEILEKLRKADPRKQSFCVRLYSTFELRHRDKRHVCIGFEKLGRSLYEFIKRNKYRGFRLPLVRKFAYQLLHAVAFCHSIKLIHTDLKPENILLLNSDYTINNPNEPRDYRVPVASEIRLIDFGGATFENDHHSKIVNTRQYRGPEVLLGLGWSYPSDLWSVGCILAELFTGELLFGTHEDLEHLALMEKVLGVKLPQSMTQAAIRPYKRSGGRSRSRSRERGGGRKDKDREKEKERKRQRDKRDDSPRRDKCKDKDSRHRSPSPPHRRRSRSPSSASRSRSKSGDRGRSSSTVRADKLLHLSDATLRWPERASRQSQRHVAKAHTLDELIPDAAFRDLIRKLLVYEPEKRVSAAQALQHPFFDELAPSDRKSFFDPKSSEYDRAYASSVSSSSSSSRR